MAGQSSRNSLAAIVDKNYFLTKLYKLPELLIMLISYNLWLKIISVNVNSLVKLQQMKYEYNKFRDHSHIT